MHHDDDVEGLVDDYLARREPHDRDGPDRRRRRRAPSPVCSRSAATAAQAAASCRSSNPSRAVDGWESPHTVVEVVSDDAPFLVDSVSSALARRGYDIHLLFHPLLGVIGVGVTSHLHLEIDRETDLEILDALRDVIEGVVDDVFAAVADWDALRVDGDRLRRVRCA